MKLESLRVDWINTPDDRARKDPGDVSGLAESIRLLTLLHPIVVNSRYDLIAGGRRLAAVRLLGWKEVPCHVVATLDDALAALRAERDENTCREPLRPTEVVELGRRIEGLERPKAKERQATSTGGAEPTLKPACGNLPQAAPGKTRDKVGDAVGVSGSTYERAKRVVEAAEADPEKFGDLPGKMDAGSVNAAHEELKRRQAAEPSADDTALEGAAADDTLPPPDGPAEPEEPKGRDWVEPPGPPPHVFADLLRAVTGLARRVTAAMKGDAEESRRLCDYLSWAGLVDHTPAKVVNGESVPASVTFLPLKGARAVIDLAGKPGRKRTEREVRTVYTIASGGWVPPVTKRRREAKGGRR